MKLPHLLVEQLYVGSGGQPDHFELVWKRPHNVQGLTPNGAGAAKDHKFLHELKTGETR